MKFITSNVFLFFEPQLLFFNIRVIIKRTTLRETLFYKRQSYLIVLTVIILSIWKVWILLFSTYIFHSTFLTWGSCYIDVKYFHINIFLFTNIEKDECTEEKKKTIREKDGVREEATLSEDKKTSKS